MHITNPRSTHKPEAVRPTTRTRGTNVQHARVHNRLAILEAVRESGQLTRAELARLTSLTPQTISSIVAELIGDGMLLEHSPQQTLIGKHPIPLSINADGGFSVGFHIQQHSIIGVLMDLSGSARKYRRLKASYPTFAGSLPFLMDTLRQFARVVGDEKLLGVGIGLPGPFGVTGLTAVGPTGLPGWDDAESLAHFREAAHVPILIENDATAAAMGERLYGAARGLRNFAYIFVGHGLGAGLYLDNRLYAGQWRNAGEIGHVVAVPHGKTCYCGKRGCFERYVSGASLLEAVGTGANVDMLSVNFSDRRFEQPIANWMKTAAPIFRYAISMMESLLDPEVILVGGTMPTNVLNALVSKATPLLPSVSERFARTTERIRLATVGRNCVALGAASLAILAELSPNYRALMK